MRIFISCFIVCGCLLCNGCKNTPVIYYNESFDNISSWAQANDKFFCVVLTDSTQASYQSYIMLLNKEYDFLQSKAIYNIADINHEENEWYLKWLKPVFLPLTCVFSDEAKLIDIIPGVSRETFLYTAEAINNKTATAFHWPNQFNANKKAIIPFLNGVLEMKEHLKRGIYLPSEYDRSTDSLNYPYSLYLRLTGELMEKDSVSAKSTAESLLRLETPSALKLYKNEFITAKKVLYPDFDVNSEPNIRVDSTTLLLPDCIVNETIPLDITVYNDGEQPLEISKIYLSCSCLELADNNEEITIPAKDSRVVGFYFTAENEGDIFRDIFIASNAINMPILHINIVAQAINANH